MPPPSSTNSFPWPRASNNRLPRCLANLRNARPHQPTTKHSNFLNFHDCIPLESLVILSEAKNLCTLPSPANCIDPSRQNAPLRMTRAFLIRSHPCQRTQLKLPPTIAIPCPPPIQAVANPYFFFRRRNSYSSVITSRVPVAPSGCPSAMAPPFTLDRKSTRLN